MTGTPLQNNTAELWALLNFIEPAKFPDPEKFASRCGHIHLSIPHHQHYLTIIPPHDHTNPLVHLSPPPEITLLSKLIHPPRLFPNTL